MKLDAKVISVLQNFQTINPSILIKPGNVLETKAPNDTIFAKATLEVSFPMEFGIYDLSRFLALASLVKEADVNFHDSFMELKSGYTNFKYVYASPNMIISPNRKLAAITPYIEFELKSDVLSSVSKAMNIMKYEMLFIKGDGKVLSLSAENPKNKSSEVFSIEIGDTDKTFTAQVESEKLKILNMNYTVQISSKGIMYLKGDAIEYWIPLNEKSRFN